LTVSDEAPRERMTDVDLRDRISHLEGHVEELAETIEGCRKIMLMSKVAIAAGGILAFAMLLGALRFDPIILIAAMTACMGGIVAFGSNSSTSKQTLAKMKDADALRAELIDRLELQDAAGGPATGAPRLT
jgi:hypothetical protein